MGDFRQFARGAAFSCLLAFVPFAAAPAADLTWVSTGNGTWSTAGNWNPNAVPTSADDLHFDDTGYHEVDLLAGNFAAASLNVSGSQDYDFEIHSFGSTSATLTLSGAGVVHLGAHAPLINLLGSIANNSSANLVLSGIGTTAGDATVQLSEQASVSFNGTATAGSAQFTFLDLTNASIVNFNDNSLAGTATITGAAHGVIQINNSASLDHATVDVRLIELFGGTLGSAHVTAENGLNFHAASDSSGAFVTMGSGAQLNVLTGNVSIGSLSGAGTASIGPNTLTIGAAQGLGNTTTYSGVISGAGALQKNGLGALVLSGINTYTGGTTVSGGTLQLGNGGTSGSLTGNVIDNGVLAFDRADSVTFGPAFGGGSSNTLFGGTISGSGALTKRGTGALILTADNTISGTTTITAGTLQLGDGGTTGSVGGAIVDNGALVVDRVGTVTLSGAITGTGGLTKIGSGVLTLTGASAYAGGTDVVEGTLDVDGSITSAVTVEDGATLGGTGSVGSADVTIGGTLAAGDGGVGTLHIAGLVLETGSHVVAEVGAGTADEVIVGGAASIAGDLTVVGAGGATVAGQYTLIATTGLLTGKFDALNLTGSFGGFDVDLKYDAHDVILVLDMNGVRWIDNPVSGDWNTGANWLTGSVPTATDKAYFSTSSITTVNINQSTTIAGINIASGAPAYTFNVAATATADSSLTIGGSGIGDASANRPAFVVAGNGGHTAMLTFGSSGSADAVLTANSGGTISFTGNADGGTSQAIVNTGGTLTIAGLTNGGMGIGSIEGAGAIVLGANTLTEGGLNTTTSFSGAIAGNGGLIKIGTGMLTLTGANTYTGGTTISGGAVQIGSGGTTGSILGDISDNALLAFNRSDVVAFAGAISGAGVVSQIGAGTTILTGASTYTGGTLIAAGTLQIGAGGALGSIVGNVTDNAALVINRVGTLTLDGVISGTGTVTQVGSGTTVLTGANTYAGTTTVSAGTLQIGAGGTSGSLGTGAVLDNAVLAFNRSDNIVVANAISGTGALQQSGTGMTALTGANTYTGGTTVSSGVLILGTGGAVGSITGNVVDNATFAVNRSDSYTFAGAISGTGAFVQAGTGTTVLTAANAYAGGTLIQQGTLELGAGVTAGSIAGDVTDNGALAFNRTDVVTFAGVVSGTGALNQIGTGTTILTGTDTYTGGTLIAAGTLQIGAGGATGSIVGDVTDNATLAFNHSDTVLFAGTIAGSGAVRQMGTGVTVLTAVNTYTGGTTITAGTLRIGNAGTTGSIVGNVLDNATLEFNRSDALGFAGAISGTGAVSQIGAGTTTLSGASTYSGLTTVASGTLQAGAVNAFSAASSHAVASILNLNNFNQTLGSLSGAGSVTMGSGNLTTGGDNSSTLFSGVTSGTGGLTKAGTGTFTLTNANTYSGGTTVTGGTLQVGNGGTTGSILGNVTDNGVFAIQHSDDLLFSATISGTGALVQSGTGRTVLTAANTYTGGTTISAGTLIMGNGGTTGSIVGDVVDNAAFIINRTDNITFAGAISGIGSLTKMNGSTLILTGNSTFTGGTAFDGTLQLGTGGTSGGIVGNIADNGLLIVNRSDTITLAGAISGAGGLNQVGTGMTVLSGVSTYTGATLITAGILDVNGSIANSAVTLNGGILKGNGTVGSLTVLSGSVAPGNSIGTLNVVGDFAFAANASYQVEVNAAGQGDRINAGGIATIAGGTVLVSAAPGNYAQQTTYRIIAATGGVIGNFGGATVDLPFFNVSLVYSTTAVDLVLQAKTIDFSPFTLTRNETAAAGAINTGGFNTDLYKAFLNQPSTAFIPAALDSLSGEVHPSIRSALIEDSRNARDAILDRLRDANGVGGGASNSRALGEHGAMWVRVFTNWGNADTDGNAGALGQSFSGIMAGGDLTLLKTLTLGIAGGYTHESLNVKSRSSRASSGDGHIAGYLGWTGGPVSLRAGVEYAWGDATVTRTVQFPGFLNNLGDKESRHSTQVFGEAGYGIDLGHIALEPFVRAAWVNAGTGAFAETGGIAALTSASASSSVTFTDVGLRFTADPIGGFLSPRASIAWQHAFGAILPGQTMQFASTGQNFLVLGVPLDRDAIAAEFGVDIQLSDAAHLGLGYDGVLSDRVQSHAVRADFIWNF